MKYDIDVANAGIVLSDVQTRSEDYEGIAKDVDGGLQGAGKASNSGIVSEALAGYNSEEFVPALEAILNLTGTAITKTNEALNHFSEGNLTMMDESVKALATTEDAPTDFREGGSTGPQAV